MTCKLPSNVHLAAEVLKHVNGFSIGSDNLAQLAFVLERDSALAADSFAERDPAVRAPIAIAACRERGKYVGICGQRLSDHPDFAHWLSQQGIESVGLNPDTMVKTWMRLATAGRPTV